MFRFIKKCLRFILFRCPFITIIKVQCDAPVYARYHIYLGKYKIYPSNTAQGNLKQSYERVIYLKVNRISEYMCICIQHWIEIAFQMSAKIVFVCDNLKLEQEMLSAVKFHDHDIIIIRSMRQRLKKIIKNMATPRWINAGYAHYTPFYHAFDNGIDAFWEIDADDTTICLNADKAAKALIEAEKYLNDTSIGAVSLDMWWTRTHYKYWTWGVAYVKGVSRFIEEFEQVEDKRWWDPYKDLDIDITADWFFTYLKDYKKMNIESFYIENSWFIHWCSFIRHSMFGYVCYWSKGEWHAPIMEYIFNSPNLGCIGIKNCLKIDIGAELEEGQIFLENYVSSTTEWPLELRKLLCLGEFSRDKYKWK